MWMPKSHLQKDNDVLNSVPKKMRWLMRLMSL
jgi:hypothetical protein